MNELWGIHLRLSVRGIRNNFMDFDNINYWLRELNSAERNKF
jgi:hypothetical protein